MKELEKMPVKQLIEEADEIRKSIVVNIEKLRMIFELLQKKGRSERAPRFASLSMRNLRLTSAIYRSLVSIRTGSISEEMEELKEENQRFVALNERRIKKTDVRRQKIREANKLKIQSLGGGTNG